MLKTIIKEKEKEKEAKGKYIKTHQPQHPIDTLSINKRLKPSIYQRVDKEKKKLKAIQIIQFKAEYNLKRKYYQQLKFYHNIIQLRRRIKLSYKYTGFSIIKDYYYTKRDKYQYIINHFTQLQKIKVLTLFYKEHIISTKRNAILRDVLVKNFNQFIMTTKQNIAINYNTFNLIRFFYFKIFSNKILLKGYFRGCNRDKVIKYKKNIKRKYQKQIIVHIKEYIRNKFKTKVLRSIRVYDDFISLTKKQIEKKKLLQRTTKYFLIKAIYCRLIGFTNSLHIAESKNFIAQMFYEEKMKKKVFSILRIKSQLMKAFRGLVIKYRLYSKSLIKDKISQEKKKIILLIHKYSKYKRQKFMPQKAKFFKVALNCARHKKKKEVINQYLIRKIKKRGWDILHSNWKRNKSFNNFLTQFVSMHNSIIMQNALNLMQYKVHRFTQKGKLPNNVLQYIQSKLEAKIYKFQFKYMKKFYKKSKRFILNKKILLKKMHLAAYFDSKKKKVKCYENFKRLLAYISLRKKVAVVEKDKLCQMIQQLPFKTIRSKRLEQSYNQYLQSFWIDQLMVSYFLINHNSLQCRKRKLLNWLLHIKQKQNSISRISTLYSLFLKKTINAILFNRFKRKLIQVILYQSNCKLLMKSYITRLIKAKQFSLEYRSKFLTIKRECLNNLNTSN